MKAIFLVLGLVGCATVPKVTTQIDQKGTVNDGKIGFDKAGKIIIQRETAADDELRIQIMVNQSLYRNMKNEWWDLKKCRENLADPKNGGNGLITDLPDVEDMSTAAEPEQEMGLTEDDSLKVVRKSSFVDRLKAERKYDTTLRAMTKTLSKLLTTCELEQRYNQRGAVVSNKAAANEDSN